MTKTDVYKLVPGWYWVQDGGRNTKVVLLLRDGAILCVGTSKLADPDSFISWEPVAPPAFDGHAETVKP